MKISKKIIALLLTVVLVFSCVSMSVSAASKNNKYPVIYIPGFMASEILSDKDNPESTPYWPMQTDNIVSAVKSAIPALGKFIIKQDWDEFGKSLVPVVEQIFNGLYFGPDGEAKDNSGVYRVYPTKKQIKESAEVCFNYDWRKDPLEVAKELDKYINHIIKVSGKEKVSISCHSQGGVIALTYLTRYGNSKIHGVAFDSAGIFGQSFNGDLLSGKVELNGEAFLYAIEDSLKGNESELLIDSILEVIEEAGLMDLVANLGNDIVAKIKPYLNESLAALFACWPSIWSMVPDKDLDTATNYIFSEVYDKNDKESKELIKKINNYNKKIRSKKEKTLLALDETSRVIVIARYGYTSMPLTPSWNTPCDGTVDLINSSFGATVADFGTTFSDKYLAKAKSKYISPSKTIDASTCLFPDKTWFIRDFQHSIGCYDLDNMIYKLLESKKEATVNTFKAYPRFMKYDIANDNIIPDDTVVEIRVPQGDMKDKLTFFAQQLLNSVKCIF